MDEIVRAWRDTLDERVLLVGRHLAERYRQTFVLKTSERTYFLKIHDEKAPAEIEQRANFHLSRDFPFIVPADMPSPFSHGNRHLTVQHHVIPGKSESEEYYLRALAALHDHGGVPGLQCLRVNTFNTIYADIEPYLHNSSLENISAAEEQYEEGLWSLREDSSVLLHGDPKVQNRFGRYLIDLERVALGSALWDIAFVLNDPELGLSDEEQEKSVRIYTDARRMKRAEHEWFAERIRGVQLVRCLYSLRWNMIHADREGATGREKIEYLTHRFNLV